MTPSVPGRRVAVGALAVAMSMAACGGESSSPSPPPSTGGSSGPPSQSTTPGEPPPGGSSQGDDAAGITAKGTYSQSGGSSTKSGETFDATAEDTSGVLVTDGGTLILTDPTVTTSGDTSSSDASSFYGLNAGVLAKSGATITITRGTVSTTGSGANGVFATGSGSFIELTDTVITATGPLAHGIMASDGGTITAANVTVDTAGSNGAAIATDRGGGGITVNGGRYATSGVDSPGIYSTGVIAVDGAAVQATGSECAVIEGSNSITLTDTSLSGARKSGVMILQSFSGDAEGSNGEFFMTGGAVSQTEGPLLFVTNATGTFTLMGVTITATSGVLLKAAADRWGTEGSNGGHAVVNASRQALAGDVIVDGISDATIMLSNGSNLTATVNAENSAKGVSIYLDASSTWNVTADSYVTTLDVTAGISGSTITNIVGNGHTVYYSASASSALGRQTYTLKGGGTLAPM